MTFCKPLLLVLFSASLLHSGCLLPSAQPVAYTPHAERVQDPMAVLREAAQKDCADGVEVKRLPTAVEYTSSCSTNFTGTEPRPTRIDFAKIASIGIVFGDWFQVELHFEDGTDDTENTHLRFSTKEEATRVADALWALRNRKQPG